MSSNEQCQPDSQEQLLADRQAPLDSRLELARRLAADGETITLPIAVLMMCDGQSVPDKYMPSDVLKALLAEYFPPGRYTGPDYDQRTVSVVEPDLTLQLLEGPLSIGGTSELFPEGRAWSQHDNVLQVNILVARPAS